MKRVLLVDDEYELLEALSFALQYSGYEVDCARDGCDALARMQRQVPDLVVTDLMMPDMDGISLCRSLRAHPDWAHIPIALHTSAHVNASIAGAPLWDAFLRKPARMDDFLSTVARLVRSRGTDASEAEHE
ncbi:response regulator [Trinickia dabaoshanensis]|uniref:Response regulator n=1 Tax=Trinickia dabaoshanensis TaxID=564714 RepID=A0A2N7VBR7_9BURK|nr:response regulator [Trinickia dabaoshanensis]PMS14557.1 response regulator [Trinickia dabaoshanensis]